MRVVAVSDVACATAKVADTSALALELDNEFVLQVKEKKQNIIDEINKQQQVMQLAHSDRIRESLRRLSGKLSGKIGRAKGGDARKKIRTGKSHIMLETNDLINVSALREQVEKTEVNIIAHSMQHN